MVKKLVAIHRSCIRDTERSSALVRPDRERSYTPKASPLRPSQMPRFFGYPPVWYRGKVQASGVDHEAHLLLLYRG